MTTRDALRSLTLGAPKRQFRVVLVPLRDGTQPKGLEDELDADGKPVMIEKVRGDGSTELDSDGQPVMVVKQRRRHPPRKDAAGAIVMVEIREPNLTERASILRAAKLGGANDGTKAEIDTLQVETVIRLTYVPGTNIRVFDDVDKRALLAQPAGGWLDDLAEVALPMLNLASEEEVSKNSKGTPSS